jgi:hypothetical protein
MGTVRYSGVDRAGVLLFFFIIVIMKWYSTGIQ